METSPTIKELLKQFGVKTRIVQKDQAPPPWDDNDTVRRWHYRVTLARGKKSYTISFWDSQYNYRNNIHPTIGHVLAALIWNNPGTVEDFCQEFGYDVDSRKAYATWERCSEQYTALCKLFNPADIDQIQATLENY